jgi:hypothetical protein
MVGLLFPHARRPTHARFDVQIEHMTVRRASLDAYVSHTVASAQGFVHVAVHLHALGIASPPVFEVAALVPHLLEN